MKMLYFIMSLYVLLLTAVPCYSESKCDDEINTEQSDNHLHGGRDNDCSYCSPFFACGTCSGTVIPGSDFGFMEVDFSKGTLIPIHKFQFLYSFLDKIWQPPKLSV